MNEEFEGGYEAAFIQDNPQEEEAHFFWVMRDFEEIITQYGPTQVVRNMKPQMAIQLLGALQHELL